MLVRSFVCCFHVVCLLVLLNMQTRTHCVYVFRLYDWIVGDVFGCASRVGVFVSWFTLGENWFAFVLV